VKFTFGYTAVTHWFGRVWFHSEWITSSACWFMLPVGWSVLVCVYIQITQFFRGSRYSAVSLGWRTLRKWKVHIFPAGIKAEKSYSLDNLSARLPPRWNPRLNIFPRAASPPSLCFTVSTPMAISRRCSERWNQNVLMLGALILPALLGSLVSEALNEVLRNFWEEGRS